MRFFDDTEQTTAAIQSNWEEENENSLAYIQNKPDIPSVGTSPILIKFILEGTETYNVNQWTPVNVPYAEAIINLGNFTQDSEHILAPEDGYYNFSFNLQYQFIGSGNVRGKIVSELKINDV